MIINRSVQWILVWSYEAIGPGDIESQSNMNSPLERDPLASDSDYSETEDSDSSELTQPPSNSETDLDGYSDHELD